MPDRPAFDVGLRTLTGPVRLYNEDAAAALERHGAFAVADGVGGHASGAYAAVVAVVALTEALANPEPRVPDAAEMHRAFEIANAHVRAARALTLGEMGCTAAALAIGGGVAVVGHVGDCRVWRVRDYRAEQLTADHTLVAKMVAAGRITADEARNHPHRNIVTRSLGPEEATLPDVAAHDARSGDVYVLCTDGLQILEPPDLARLCQGRARGAADHLADLANARDGHDNVAVIVVRVR